MIVYGVAVASDLNGASAVIDGHKIFDTDLEYVLGKYGLVYIDIPDLTLKLF